METKFHRDLREIGEAYEQWVISRWPAVYGKRLTPVVGQSGQYAYGDTAEGVEIKNDERRKETGNLYIETHEKADSDNANYVPSGIYHPACPWYLIGDRSCWYIFDKAVLVGIDRKNDPVILRRVTTSTSKGFLLKEQDAQQFAIRYQEFDEDGKPKDDTWLEGL